MFNEIRVTIAKAAVWLIGVLIVGLIVANTLVTPLQKLRGALPAITRDIIQEAKEAITVREIVAEVFKQAKAEVHVKALVGEVFKQIKDEVVVREMVQQIFNEAKNQIDIEPIVQVAIRGLKAEGGIPLGGPEASAPSEQLIKTLTSIYKNSIEEKQRELVEAQKLIDQLKE
ncbi:MAG: hypothetical protein HY731_12795, partial [Candidatus Tectomicrobia bacterium]|nr:hypothetical protein [Candidatus Tectomicrobia bacterium]